MGQMWCTGTVEREKLLESYNGYVALVGARGEGGSVVPVLPLGEWVGKFASDLCGSDADGFLPGVRDTVVRADVLQESGCGVAGAELLKRKHEGVGVLGGAKLVRSECGQLGGHVGLLRGPNGGLSIGRGPRYEANQRNRERRKARTEVVQARSEAQCGRESVLSTQEQEAKKTLAEVWIVQNKLKLSALSKKLAEEEAGVSAKELVLERKAVEERARLVAARQKLAVVESRDVENLVEADKLVSSLRLERERGAASKVQSGSGGVGESKSGSVSPSSSVSNREKALEKQVKDLMREGEALRVQLRSVSGSASSGSGSSERELVLERRNKELEVEVKNLKQNRLSEEAASRIKVYHRERDKVYQEYLKIKSENEKLKSQLQNSPKYSGATAGPSVDVQVLLRENAQLQSEVAELRKRPVVKDGITERDIAQLNTWGVQTVAVKRSWF